MSSLLIVTICVTYGSAEQVLQLKPGKVLGFDYQTKKGDVAEVFLNIPYALPPVDELRFERPKPISSWKNIRDGTAFGPACYATVPKTGFHRVQMSEDCLTLNIIRPKKEAGFPILFWIHGGGYQFGSAYDYGYKGFAEIYIPNDIIVVTIQYRLGIYGKLVCIKIMW
ncbi:hypothetical protein OESDEN_20122 [Oesophagostomum dentatum]|uniref:Carboxylesterase type B domain-containing protein n=1 Tax=Oesophagostomum dentatum TaxID=61180 RepID=A0A0B1S9L9_OESDE|nr:hypothetical protein OESDEN_20122 [Oesophagostomum dentatum]